MHVKIKWLDLLLDSIYSETSESPTDWLWWPRMEVSYRCGHIEVTEWGTYCIARRHITT